MSKGYGFKFHTVSFNFYRRGDEKMSLLQNSMLFLKKNASTILTYIGSAGVIATSVMAVKVTPKALTLLENAKTEKGEELTKTEKIKVAGPAYIPAVLIGASTIACIFGANILNQRQQAALMSAYALLDNSYKDYKKKIKELYDNDVENTVRNEITKDKYNEDTYPVENAMQLFYDEFSQRYFESTTENVIHAEYEVNRMLAIEYSVYLNDFYVLLGIDRVDYGDYLGWSMDKIVEIQRNSWIDFRHQKVIMEDGMECTIISMYTEPTLYMYF